MSEQSPTWILDSSSLIEVKQLFRGNEEEQKRVFAHMEALLASGHLAYPRELLDELGRWVPEDLPYKWAKGNRGKMTFHDPQYSTLQHVMAIAGDVVDPYKQREDADPYVLAMALEIKGEGATVVVVTEDFRDRSSHISLATACRRLGLVWRRTREFLLAEGIVSIP